MRNPFKRRLKLSEFKIEDYLDSDEALAEYLNAALLENDPKFFRVALGDVAKARGGMARVAEEVGVGRESLYKSLSADGNPRFGTIVDVLHALGFRFTIAPNS